LEVFKQVKVNIPLLDMIQQIPAYAKFLKDLCTKKRKTNVPKKAFLTANISSILSNSSPIKYKDPGCPTISCAIGDTFINKALLDLGASVNLLPFSVYEQLNLGPLKPSKTTLQFADCSIKKPRGIVEDVLIKVGDFIYPVDFVVLDTEPVVNPKRQIPVILGRPFLATSEALINCRNGLMQLSFGNLKAEFNIFHVDSEPEIVCNQSDVVMRSRIYKISESNKSSQNQKESEKRGSNSSTQPPSLEQIREPTQVRSVESLPQVNMGNNSTGYMHQHGVIQSSSDYG